MGNNKKDNFDKLIISGNLISSKKYSCPKTVELPSWDVAKEIFKTATDQWIFRGQDDSSFGLLPSLYRFRSGIGHSLVEEIILKNFFKADILKDYPEINDYDPQTQFEWLCIQQHYGIPTRLLDWTKCPYIATWFALYPLRLVSYKPDCAVWAVNKEWCKYRAFSQIRSIEKYGNLSDDVDLSSDKYFKDLFFSNHELNLVFPFEVPEKFRKIESFKRMNNQQSIFLCAGNDHTGFFGEAEFKENLCFNSYNMSDEIIKEREDYIIKFVIKNEQENKILEDLKSEKITHSYLFNSLDQYSQYFIKVVRTIGKLIKEARED